MKPHDYCQDLAATSGSTLHYSVLFLPPETRKSIVALYAFCREAENAVRACSDQGVTRMKLHWWREEIERTYAGAAQHPVGRALQPIVGSYDLPREQFLEILDGVEMVIGQTQFRTFRDLLLYCHRTGGVRVMLATEIYGYQDRQTIKHARNLGIALQLTDILRFLRDDALSGRIYLPLEELSEFRVTHDTLRSGKGTNEIRALLAFQVNRTREFFDEAFALLPPQDRYPQRGALTMAAIYMAILRAIEKAGVEVLKRRIGLTPLHKLWIAWTIAQRENRHHKRHDHAVS